MWDALRVWPEFVRLNVQKALFRRRVAAARKSGEGRPVEAAPCQSSSDSGRIGKTRCDACIRFDRSARYRRVCPDLIVAGNELMCGVDSAEVRPYWWRAAGFFALPLVVVIAALPVAAWGFYNMMGVRVALPDLILPSRWSKIAEARHAHFYHNALKALAAGDAATASVAIFSAAQTGQGSRENNLALARLATLGGFLGLSDALHAKLRASDPGHAREHALHWHDDLLLANLPAQIARLALVELTQDGASREFWLAALLDALRHPGVAAVLNSAPEPVALPHPSLAYAIAARAALDRGDNQTAAEQLEAFASALPGLAGRNFLALTWLDLGRPQRAMAAALDERHPALPGETALLAYRIHASLGEQVAARNSLQPSLAGHTQIRRMLAALMIYPDGEPLSALCENVLSGNDISVICAFWVAARRARHHELAGLAVSRLAALDRPVRLETLALNLAAPTSADLRTLVAVVPLDRESLRALRDPRIVSVSTGIVGLQTQK